VQGNRYFGGGGEGGGGGGGGKYTGDISTFSYLLFCLA